MIVKISRNGKITIPKTIRTALELKSGDKIRLKLESEDHVLLIPIKSSIKDLKGFLPKPNRPIPIEEINNVFYKKYNRELRKYFLKSR